MLARDPNSSALGLEADLQAFLSHPHSHGCDIPEEDVLRPDQEAALNDFSNHPHSQSLKIPEEDVPNPNLEVALIAFLNHPHSQSPTETDDEDNATILNGECSLNEAVREPPSNWEDELPKPQSGNLTKQVDILGGRSEPLIQLEKSLSAESNEQEPLSATELLRSLDSYYRPSSQNDSPAFSSEEGEGSVDLYQSLRRSSLEDPTDYERVIILVGPSGSGKTSFIDDIIGENSNPYIHSLLQGKSFSGPFENLKLVLKSQSLLQVRPRSSIVGFLSQIYDTASSTPLGSATPMKPKESCVISRIGWIHFSAASIAPLLRYCTFTASRILEFQEMPCVG